MKASKLTARGLAYVVRGVGRKIAKHHRAKQTPHGKQSVKKLMAHGASASSIELSGDTKPVSYTHLDVYKRQLHGLAFGTLYAPLQALMYGYDWRGMLTWISLGFPMDVLLSLIHI